MNHQNVFLDRVVNLSNDESKNTAGRWRVSWSKNPMKGGSNELKGVDMPLLLISIRAGD